MRDFGLPEEIIPDSGFSPDIRVQPVAGCLVAGEETALLRLLEGRQAMPYLRGPYPAERGLGGNPTLIQNIETLANVAVVFQESPQHFASIGTPRSTGTKIVTLTDSGIGPCTIEVPFGTSLQQILASTGSASDNGTVKAIQLGGPLGSYWSGDTLNNPLDYDAVAEAGAIIGSGTIDVVALDACMVQETARMMAYTHSQSCGQCVFCREGTLQMTDILESIQNGQGNSDDLSLLKELGEHMRAGCICGLGRNASNPVLSALALFESDFDSHIKGNPCPADSGSDAAKE
jgi:NADH:ubiquinone oxidoreductase subunit F (NADH-binding)